VVADRDAGQLSGAIIFAAFNWLASILWGEVHLALFRADRNVARLGLVAGLRPGFCAPVPFALSLALASLGAGITISVGFGAALAALIALTTIPRS